MTEYKLVRLGDVCEIVSGSTPKTDNAEFWNGTLNWVTPAELTDNLHVIYETERKITQAAVEKTHLSLLPKGTVLLSSRAPIGKTAITGTQMYCNQGFKNLICGNQLFNEFAFWFLRSKTAYLNSLGRGATFKEISKSIVEEVQIPLPPLETQKHIAAVLDKCTALIAKHKLMLEKYDTLIKSRFIEMFGDISTGKYKFETRKLGEVAEVGSSHRVFTTEFVEQGIPFYRGTEIGELANGKIPQEPYYISEEHYQRLIAHDSKPQIGDLLMPSICNKGQVWMVDTDTPFYYKDGRVLSISPNQKIYNSKYLQYFMREKTIVEYPKLGSGSTFAEFKIFLLKDIDVLTPPISLQNDFATFVHQIDGIKSTVQKSLEKAEILYKSLMQTYFG